MKLEAESDGMQPQAKEHLEPPEAGRDREDSPLGPRGEGGAANNGISHSGFQDWERINCYSFIVLGHLLVIYYSSPERLIHLP